MIAFAPSYVLEPYEEDSSAEELLEQLQILGVAIELLEETLDVLDEKFAISLGASEPS